jgi:hypothetical protein
MHLAAMPEGGEFVTFDRSLMRRAGEIRGVPMVQDASAS